MATEKCKFLNNRVVKGDKINAECECENKETDCPKIRSMKGVVSCQCWKVAVK